MEADLKPKKRHNVEHLSESRYTKAKELSYKVLAKFPGLIASCLVSRPSRAGENIDMMFLIDDLNNVVVDQKLSDVKLAASEIAFNGELKLDCDAMLASVFWGRFRSKEEKTMELARSSLVLHDNGFFTPIQDLLVTGKIRPTKESVNIYYVKAERSLKTSEQKLQRAVVDLYWAVTDTAHAAVMVAGITPPSPAHLAETLKSELIKRNLVHKRCGEILDRIYTIAKKVMHREVFEISGREFDSLRADADFFIKEMDDFVKEHVK